jgi:glutamine synthetase
VKDLVYVIPAAERNADGLKRLLSAHPEIRFVSLAAVDLGGNDTDEKIPVAHFLKDIEEYLGGGVQTDGSSVVLPGIATLNDGKVDLITDPSVKWIIDYNHEFKDPEQDLAVGTLRIPSFLKHRERLVDSRAILQKTIESAQASLLELLRKNPPLARAMQIDVREIKELKFCAATELECWVRTPGTTVETEKLAVSQGLQESYWKRTKGSVRSALEHSLLLLEKYELYPEMGHKEVGGVKATLAGQGRFGDIMEQLEIDWKYAPALQAADNELLARITIKEVFRQHGLEVTFMAKPIEGVAGSGEHTHVSIMAALRDGSMRNLFAPLNPQQDFLSPLGWGALMGLLRNYEVIGSFVTSTNDAFNRLKPGFEAPICIVASIGHDISMPSRNRTVLVGLIRDQGNPLATRFEVRSPNPHTNTYLAIAAFYLGMLDGMKYAASSGKSAAELQGSLCKAAGIPDPYLEADRAYRSEEDVFEHYPEGERRRLFGVPPANVWQTLENLKRYPEKTAVLQNGGVFSPDILEAYRKAMITRWTMELVNRIIPNNADFVRACVKGGDHHNALDSQRWDRIQALRHSLMRDDLNHKSIFTAIKEATEQLDHQEVSRLQEEMAKLMSELREVYQQYKRNLGAA